MIFIFLFLVPSSLQAETSWEGALDSLLAAPWTKSPSSLPDSSAWKIEPYMMTNTFEQQGYNLRAFVQDKESFRTKLFTYMEPSLSSFRETILMGYIQTTVRIEDEAKRWHGEMIACLKSRGFESMPPDTSRIAIGLRRIYEGSELFRKGDMDGRVYYIKDYRTEKWFIRTSISHSRFGEFKNAQMAEWPKWWYEEYFIPNRLVGEMDCMNTSSLLSPSIWAMIRSARDSVANYRREVNQTRVKDLIVAYETMDRKTFSDADLPTILLMKNYLARYLFYNGFWKEITHEQGKWLDTHGLGYSWSELGQANNYNEAILMNLITEHPDSYWGHFAFLELLKMGFDTSGTCRNGQDQWTVVLKEGNAFLEKYPDSPFAPDIRFYLGKAAETLFNLGAVEDHPARDTYGLSMSQYADKREESRKRAIEYYEKVLQSSRKEIYADHLKYILPRLRAGFGTGCDYYFCFYD